MTLSAEQEARVVAEVTKELTERAWAKLEGELDDVVCISMPRLAGMLDLSTTQARRIVTEVVDFGPRETRVTLRQARDLVRSRKRKRGEDE